MNYVIVRTKLQAILALELLEKKYLDKPFTLIGLYQNVEGEDSSGVYAYYDLLSKKAIRTKSIVQADGLVPASLRLFTYFCHARFTGGRIYYASINCYPVAIALKLCARVSVNTFDDGTANTQVGKSAYHSDTPLNGKGLKRRLARMIFPRGPSSFVRKRIARHFTIYPDLPNIVPPEKCVTLKLVWADYLHDSDKVRLPKKADKIMLGTVFEEHGDPERISAIKKERDAALGEVDLYFPHPRETLEFEDAKIFSAISPAESLIDYFAMNNDLVVYHFNSSTILGFVEDRRVTLIDHCGIIH